MNAARLVLPALRAREQRFDHEAQVIAEALALGVGGFIIFGGTRESVRELTTQIQERVTYPLLFAADLERGAGQQFQGLTAFPPPRALASLMSDEVIRTAAAITAREARSVGINWIFAPVADLDIEPQNPIVQTRAFAGEASRVAHAVEQWIAGCQGEGVAACVKHFPGHGRTVTDSHGELPVVGADRETLATDLIPFRAAVDAGVASVMTAHVSYPALDPSGFPATRSPTIISILRDDLGFEGPVVTDALMMAGATAGISEAEAAREVVMAGVDLLLYPRDTVGVIAALHEGVAQSGEFSARIAQALTRRGELLQRFNPPPEQLTAPFATTPAGEIADQLISAASRAGVPGILHEPIDLVVIDDDQDGDWPTSSNQVVTEMLQGAGVALGPGGSRVVLLFCEARAGKRRGGFGPATMKALEIALPADLIILFGHERLRDDLPAGSPVVVAWHRQPLMQRAAAAFLQSRST